MKSFLRVSRVDNLGRALGSSPQVLVFANPRDFGHNMCLCKHNIIIYSFLNDFAQEKSVVKYALRNKELRSDPESYVSLLHLKDTGSSMYIRREREREKKNVYMSMYIHSFIYIYANIRRYMLQVQAKVAHHPYYPPTRWWKGG